MPRLQNPPIVLRRKLGSRRDKNKDSDCRAGAPFTKRKDYSFGPSSGVDTSARSSSSGSSGSSSSRKAGSSDGAGTAKPAGNRPSNRPEPLSSSSPGKSPTASSPKWDRNASLVP